MDIDSPGRRERKKSETRRALRTSALRLSAERGFQRVTVEEIAEAADVSVRTFYSYFPSKEDAIVGFDATRVEQLRVALEGRPLDEEPLWSLRSVLSEMLSETSEEWPLRMRVIKADPSLLPRMFSSFAVFERAMIDVIAQRTGVDASLDLYPSLVTAVATGALRASIGVWRSNGEETELADFFESAFEQVAGGLRCDQGVSGVGSTRVPTKPVRVRRT